MMYIIENKVLWIKAVVMSKTCLSRFVGFVGKRQVALAAELWLAGYNHRISVLRLRVAAYRQPCMLLSLGVNVNTQL